MSTAGRLKSTNVMILLSALEKQGEQDAAQLEMLTGIKKAIIVSTLFTAKKHGQINTRPKGAASPQPAFDAHRAARCVELSKFGWTSAEIADKLAIADDEVEILLTVMSAPSAIRDLVERGVAEARTAVLEMERSGAAAKDSLLETSQIRFSPEGAEKRQQSKGLIYQFRTYERSPLPRSAEQPRHQRRDDSIVLPTWLFQPELLDTIAFFDSRGPGRVVTKGISLTPTRRRHGIGSNAAAAALQS